MVGELIYPGRGQSLRLSPFSPGKARVEAVGLKLYLPLALVAFVAATTGADLVARTSIGGETFAYALNEHVHWASVQWLGTLLLLVPFVAIAFICAIAERRARTRGTAAIFGVAMVTLLYFYVDGHQGAQHALLAERWTAATLSIGLLPFFVGIPLIMAAAVAGALAAGFDRRPTDPARDGA